MAAELVCAECLATFSRPEHLKRHSSATHGNARQHVCVMCGSAFNRKDVLRRHEKTCKGLIATNSEQYEDDKVGTGHETHQIKRQRHYGPSDAAQSIPEQGSLSLAAPSLPAQDDTSNESAMFDFVFNQAARELFNLSSPVDFYSDLPFLNGKTSDIFTAEKLEYLAYFTSTRGMSSFTDSASFPKRQRMACQVHENKATTHTDQKSAMVTESNDCRIEDNTSDCRQSIQDLMQLKSNEILVLIKSTICNKKNDEIITIGWSRQTQQLCGNFFSPANICRFLDYFWSLWYPHCPIIHRPRFDAYSAWSPLLCVMVVIGACLSPGDGEPDTARIWLDTIEELIFSSECFHEDAKLHYNSRHTRKERVQWIQASYLVCSLQKREGTVDAQTRVRRHRHVSMVALARNIGPKSASHRYLTLEEPSASWWRQFAEEEELIRTIVFIFLIDAALTILHNSPPRMVVSELKMEVASPEACFQAGSATECFEALKPWASSRFWTERLSIVSAVRRICQTPIDDDMVQEFSQLGTLNLFTLVQAIHSLMFQFHNSLIFESTLTPIQTGLENWRRIWNERVPEDTGLPDTPGNLWKQVGFLRQASGFWQLARILADRIMSTTRDDEEDTIDDVEISRYDHTDMGEVNGLIMEYRRLNLGES